MVVYEPTLPVEEFHYAPVVSDLARFKQLSDVIVSNRMDHQLKDVIEKVYTRDIFRRDE